MPVSLNKEQKKTTHVEGNEFAAKEATFADIEIRQSRKKQIAVWNDNHAKPIVSLSTRLSEGLSFLYPCTSVPLYLCTSVEFGA